MTLRDTLRQLAANSSTTPPAVALTAIALQGHPTADHVYYRCRITSYQADGSIAWQQATQSRHQPDWLLRLTHAGPGPLALAADTRPEESAPWQTLAEASLIPADALDGGRGAAVDLPATGDGPGLQFHLQLSLAGVRNAPKSFAALERFANGSGGRPAGKIAAAARTATRASAPPAEIGDAPPLTPQEEVIVKDTWNKLLAFHEMLMDVFFERLLHEEPDLIDRFGEAVDHLSDLFCGLFDRASRQLQPHTENVLRESYRHVPGLPAAESATVDQLVGRLADLGMRPHHWLTARKVWVWMLGEIPYMEEYERENLRRGTQSAPYKFFTRHVLLPALHATRAHDEALAPAVIAEMRRCAEVLAADANAVGMDFYQTLFTQHPEILPYFGRTDVDHLAGHLIKSISFLAGLLSAGDDVMGILRQLAAVHTEFGIPPDAYPALAGPMIAVMRRHDPDFTDELERGWRVLLGRVIAVLAQPMINRRKILDEAGRWLELIAREQEWPDADRIRRRGEIEREIQATGTYTHTYEELAYGAQVAWRNSPKCVGRISWRNMIVRDLRHVNDPDEMFREAVEHVRMGVNGGNMQIVMNAFRPKRPGERWGPRFWNLAYFRYAGYRQPDGTMLGDGANAKLTDAILRLGWTPPEPKGEYDVLPLVIEVPGYPPKMYEFDRQDIMEIRIEHPTIPAIGALGLRWMVIPAIATFRMDIGGIHYACIPFNGWFMQTEIARNLWEPHRYNKAEAIANALGLDTSSEQTLWRDRAFLELNVAILHSFSKAKVSLVDHQTASRQFLTHDLREKKAGREVPAQWSWVVPAAGGSATPVWHHEMRDFYLSPHYHYAADKWAVLGEEIAEATATPEEESAGVGVVILYGSETGTSEGYARQAARRLKQLRPRVLALDEFDPLALANESLALIVTSTFGDGDFPNNARRFGKRIGELSRGALTGLKYAVMALGSTVYPHFCAAGVAIDRELSRLGGLRLVALHKGDEIKGQADTVRQWLDLVARLLGEDPTAAATGAEMWPRARWIEPPPIDPTPAAVTLPVIENRELLKEVIPGSRSTRQITFDLSGSGMSYETGDHLSVHPRNPESLVRGLCARLGVDTDAWFVVEQVDAAGQMVAEDSESVPAQVGRLLAEELDLTLREPLRELVALLEKSASDPAERQRLESWRETLARGDQDENCSNLTKQIVDEHVTILALLEAFPATTPEFAALIELLPKQKPRLYSISSSPLVHPDKVQVTIGVLHVTTDAGQPRPGLCSNYLAGLEPAAGDRARAVVRTSTFRPPVDPSVPTLMVGPGTGLSPLIGFLQHRGAQMQLMRTEGREVQPGHARLYFGCRDTNDYLYQQELETWRDEGTITHLAVAFSRASEKKIYVQHLIAEHGAELWEVLGQANCHYYVCGDAKMADDVFEALMLAAQRQGGLSRGQAVDFFDRMKAEKRYHADVWGVTLNYKRAIEEVREAKYSQGERWLRQIQEATS